MADTVDKFIVSQVYEKDNQNNISSPYPLGANFTNIIDTNTKYTLAQFFSNYLSFMDTYPFTCVGQNDPNRTDNPNPHIQVWIDTTEGNQSQLPPPLQLQDINLSYIDEDGEEHIFPSSLTLLDNKYIQIVAKANYKDPVTEEIITKDVSSDISIKLDGAAFEIINNYVRPLQNGSFTLEVAYKDQKVTSTVVVDIPIPVGIEILYNDTAISEYIFTEYNSITLDYQIVMSDGSKNKNYDITWSTNDTDGNIVINDGELTAYKNTTSPVEVKATLVDYSAISASINVSVEVNYITNLLVYYKTEENGTIIESSSYNFTSAGDSIYLVPRLEWHDGTIEDASSNATAITDSPHVTIDGLKITSVDDGTATISVSWTDNDQTFTADFTCEIEIPVVPQELLIYYNNGTEEVLFPDNYKFESRWDEGVTLIPKIKMSDGTIVDENITLTKEKGTGFLIFDPATNILKPSTKFRDINKTDLEFTFSWSDDNAE